MISKEVAEVIETVVDKLGYVHTNIQLLNWGSTIINNTVYVDRANDCVRIIVCKTGAMHFIEEIESAINKELSKINYKTVRSIENQVNDITYNIAQL
ncbi:MAG: hypothetical protein K2O31_00730 [Clostridia bacterium]|nr:hypothetical protein [Clostridia bacterium]MDE7208390.1 hypothetical protein [Clostridia bacterium]